LTNATLLLLCLLILASWLEGDFLSLAASFPAADPSRERAVMWQSEVHAPAIRQTSADEQIDRSLATPRSPAVSQRVLINAAAVPGARKHA